jgi:hypothetical protein
MSKSPCAYCCGAGFITLPRRGESPFGFKVGFMGTMAVDDQGHKTFPCPECGQQKQTLSLTNTFTNEEVGRVPRRDRERYIASKMAYNLVDALVDAGRVRVETQLNSDCKTTAVRLQIDFLPFNIKDKS